jgi:hypothetical protein
LDPLDGLEVRLAATPRERPACDRREISQRASRSLAVALRIATRSGPVLVQESVRPSLGVLPVVHGTGYRRLTVLPEDRARPLDLVRPNPVTKSIAVVALTMSVIVVLVRSDWAPAADDWWFARWASVSLKPGTLLPQDERIWLYRAKSGHTAPRPLVEVQAVAGSSPVAHPPGGGPSHAFCQTDRAQKPL